MRVLQFATPSHNQKGTIVKPKQADAEVEARQKWLASLKEGDRVMAGVGMHAELRGRPDNHTAVVRWLNYDDGQWWGYHHSRVPASTLQPWVNR